MKAKPKKDGKRKKQHEVGRYVSPNAVPRVVRCLGPGCTDSFLSEDPSRYRYCIKCEAKRDELSQDAGVIPVYYGFAGMYKYHD